MTNEIMNKLSEITLAPWIQKGTALIGKERIIGGNLFRHQMMTLAILIDYSKIDRILLCASVIHDLFEDTDTKESELYIDDNAPEIINLVKEVTRRKDETKREYLSRLVKNGSEKAWILKSADRLSNLIDINLDIFGREFIIRYLGETEEFILPKVAELDKNMFREMTDLIERKKKLIYI